MKYDARLMVALAAASLPGLAVSQEAGQMPAGFGYAMPRELNPRRSEFRRGRRSNYGVPDTRPAWERNGDNPAGTKLAKKMARGQLTKNGIR